MAETAATMTIDHSDYALLAGRVCVLSLHKDTKKLFSGKELHLFCSWLKYDSHIVSADVIHDLYSAEKNGFPRPKISEKTYSIVMKNAQRFNSAIVSERDFTYSIFAIKTLERSYLMRIDDRIVERPQHMLMRCAVGIHGEDIDAVIETYNLLSEKYFTHASPTLFSAGKPRAQLSSCFLLAITEDSMKGIYETLGRCTMISKYAGLLKQSYSLH